MGVNYRIRDLLYKHSLVVFRGIDRKNWDPAAQYKLTKMFDPSSESYGHGNNKTGAETKSILHPDLKTIPSQPQVQLIGNGQHDDEYVTRGLPTPVPLKHPHHRTFHKEPVSLEDEKEGITRFYRWHIDAALYGLDPPVATTLFALSVPQGPKQKLRYDDGTGDELEVPLGTTAFVSGKKMFDILSPEQKSFAVRAKVQYAPHPYVWMSPAAALSTGLGIHSDGKEMKREELPPWSEDKIKVFPVTWKNPVTGDLHVQVHPCGAETIYVDAIPESSPLYGKPDQLYPEGGHITDLKTVREILYSIQRPGIAPGLVYAHDWQEGDLCIFHNRGVLHTVVGAFTPEQKRAFWQCNLAASYAPVGPDANDVKKYA
ncbi:alpha-ketoglutarate dependent xanthine dioxygenase [Atractiella rhizophila]|nr:alpha-ketoglutarate dependent xanthine dioxygenase [Atractiella rhizophila]